MLAKEDPILIINCKTYGESTGVLARNVAKASVEVLNKRRTEGKKMITICVAVPATEIHTTSSLGLVPVLAEHVDASEPGAHTGSITIEDIKYHGAIGSLVNHSEDPTGFEEIRKAVDRLRENGLISVVCAKDAETAKRIAELSPDYIAVEPPELIGGDVSVSTSRPELIQDSVKEVHEVKEIPVLVGAGVKTGEDVRIASQLGSKGILVASGVAKAKDIVKAIEELVRGFD